MALVAEQSHVQAPGRFLKQVMNLPGIPRGLVAANPQKAQMTSDYHDGYRLGAKIASEMPDTSTPEGMARWRQIVAEVMQSRDRDQVQQGAIQDRLHVPGTVIGATGAVLDATTRGWGRQAASALELPTAAALMGGHVQAPLSNEEILSAHQHLQDPDAQARTAWLRRDRPADIAAKTLPEVLFRTGQAYGGPVAGAVGQAMTAINSTPNHEQTYLSETARPDPRDEVAALQYGKELRDARQLDTYYVPTAERAGEVAGRTATGVGGILAAQQAAKHATPAIQAAGRFAPALNLAGKAGRLLGPAMAGLSAGVSTYEGLQKGLGDAWQGDIAQQAADVHQNGQYGGAGLAYDAVMDPSSFADKTWAHNLAAGRVGGLGRGMEAVGLNTLGQGAQSMQNTADRAIVNQQVEGLYGKDFQAHVDGLQGRFSPQDWDAVYGEGHSSSDPAYGNWIRSMAHHQALNQSRANELHQYGQAVEGQRPEGMGEIRRNPQSSYVQHLQAGKVAPWAKPGSPAYKELEDLGYQTGGANAWQAGPQGTGQGLLAGGYGNVVQRSLTRRGVGFEPPAPAPSPAPTPAPAVPPSPVK